MSCCLKTGEKREKAAKANAAVTLETLDGRSHCPTGENDWVHFPALEPPGDPLPSQDRPILKIYMNQAVIGDLHRVQLYTGQFSNCRPVLLYNRETGVAGLFHYPGGGLSSSSRASTVAILQKLSERVDPTDVYILQGVEPNAYDQDDLLEFFQDKNPHVSDEKYGGICVTLGPDDQLVSNRNKVEFSGPGTPQYDFNQMAANLHNLPRDCELLGTSNAGGFSGQGGTWMRL